MYYPREVSRSSLIDTAAFLVRDIERTEAYRHQVRTLPNMAAKYDGEVQGMRTALAYLAGAAGYGTWQELADAARMERPTITGGDRRVPVPAGWAPSPDGGGAELADALDGPRSSAIAAAYDRADQAAQAGDIDPMAAWPIDHEGGE